MSRLVLLAWLAPVGLCASGRGDVMPVFSNSTALELGEAKLQKAFDAVYQNLNRSFDYVAFARATKQFQSGLQDYHGSNAYLAYTYYPDRPHCDVGVVATPKEVSGASPYPGGSVSKLFGTDFSKAVHDLSREASGPASAGLAPVAALNSQSLKLGMGMVQSVIAALVHTVPPLIPPPTWNNQPLPCAPMVTGHNCFGAVLYPITMADFTLADVTDSMLDGVVAGFPSTYATKVGKTSDATYKACFASYMRMWVEDIIGTCSMVSVPPLCTQAFFMNLWRLPPQYASIDEAQPYPKTCPRAAEADVTKDSTLYEADIRPDSPILKEVLPVKGQPVHFQG